MRIVNGKVYVNGSFVPGIIETVDDLISLVLQDAGELKRGRAKESVSHEEIDATGCFVVPGLIDLHFHGCVGSDLCDGMPEALATIVRYEASHGITGICPATMTYSEERLTRVLACVSSFETIGDGAALLGVNMEGPYISPRKIGAQNPAYVRKANVDEFRRLQEAAHGAVKIVDIAPEEPGALAFIKALSSEVRVSLAHMCATYDEVLAAFQAGARQVTHLYNAMPGLHHRNPGPIAAATEYPEVTPEIIADGVHVHPAMVRLAFTLFGADRMILISDSMRACGLPDGVYDLGGQQVQVTGNHATLANGTLAGSVTDLAACLRTAITEMGIPPEDAVKAATINPAKALGVDGERGRLEAGKIADIVLLDEGFKVKQVMLRGKLL